MMTLWIRAVLLRRSGRVLGAAAGIAGAAALLLALGAFLSSSTATMMRRALENVPIDWQVQLMPGADVEAVESAMGAATRIVERERVQFADVAGFEARTGDSVQTTGAAKVVGVAPTYWTSFPGQLRGLLGATDGVLMMQQTAANLHVTVGDLFTVHRTGLPDVELKVGGIVDLPNADAMFQGVGLPAGAAPLAPPDNVALIPAADWRRLFDAQAALRPDTTRLQLHARIDRDRLPTSPEAAYPAVLAAGHNLEARIAGQALLANNIATRLDAIRTDSLYAKMLFLFLGAPGIVLAALLTMAVGATGRDQRRRDHALLRVRGASNAQILSLAAAEAMGVGVIGLLAGLALAWIATATLLHSALPAAANWPWLLAAAVGALSLAMASVLVPSRRELQSASVHAQRAALGPDRAPVWRRAYLDVVPLAASGALFWQAAGAGYQVVLAPEGVPATSVQNQAFLAPLLLLLGVGLLTLRVVGHGLVSGRVFLARVFRPLAGPLSRVVAAALARQRQRLVGGVGLTTLAFAFATSTAIFNETFRAQALVDAQLTNGADVSVSGPPFADVSAKLDEVSRFPGVAAAEAMQHRLA
jgi:putative ABC transport system permease protein